MPQQYLRDVFHLRNDLRTTFAILKSRPSTCEMTFYILHFERTIYSWIQYLDLKGKNEVERKDKERGEWDAFCNRKVKVG